MLFCTLFRRDRVHLCSESVLNTSLVMLSMSTHLSQNNARVIQSDRPTVFLRTPVPNQTSLTEGAVTHVGLLSMSSAMAFYTLAYL